MGGREGLVQRRLIKAMEDVMACYDRTVHNSLGYIIQFLYGEDGLDAMHIEKQKVPHILIGELDFKKMYEFDLLSGQWSGDLFLDPLIKENIRNNHLSQITLRQELQQLRSDRKWFRESIFQMIGKSCSIYLPVNIKRLIWNAQKEFGIKEFGNTGHSELNPVDIVAQVNKLCNSIRVLPKGKIFILIFQSQIRI